MAYERKMRPDPTNGEDPRMRAAARAAAIREHLEGAPDDVDKFYIPLEMVPDGWCYEWKVMTVFGAANPSAEVHRGLHGWEPVPASRHPEFMPAGTTSPTIDRDGLRLYERPAEISEDARQRDLREARAQMRQKEEQLGMPGSGQFDRDNKGQSLVNVKRSVGRIEVPAS
jgi:hypothetical protein